MGCLYWIFIGWWWEPSKWLLNMEIKILYWIYIGWWLKIVSDPEIRKWVLRIFTVIVFAAVFTYSRNHFSWISILILIACVIILLISHFPVFFKRSGSRTQPSEPVEFYSAEVGSLDFTDGHSFEQICADILRNNGFYDVRITKGDRDCGVDMTAFNHGMKYVIECEQYSGKVGITPVQEVYSKKHTNKADIAVVMSSSYFTQQAKDDAYKLGVELWDRDKINLMAHSGAEDTE